LNFEALIVEGDILLAKPFQDLGFEGAVRWKLPEGSNSKSEAWPAYLRCCATA
jgi:hypothetical protein